MTGQGAFARALGLASRRDEALAALGALVAGELGVRLFTVTSIDYGARLHRRDYSNMPDVYPVYGDKPLLWDAWSDLVIDRRQTYVANSLAEMAPLFPDTDVIARIGCGSVLNMPVVVRSEVVASLNLLDVAGHFTPLRTETCENLLRLPAIACYLLAA